MSRYESWDDIDRLHGRIVSAMTCLVLTINDQCYNQSVALMEELRGSELYRFKVKQIADGIENAIRAYNGYIFKQKKVNAEVFANITQSMEDDILPYIEKYRWAVSQHLLNKGVVGKPNSVAAISLTISMLADISNYSLHRFMLRMEMIVPLAKAPFSNLSIHKAGYLATELAERMCGKISVNLQDDPVVNTAFKALDNVLSNVGIYEKALCVKG